MKQILFLAITFLTASFSQAQFLKDKNSESFTGFFNFHYVSKEGKIYIEVPVEKLNEEFLYVHSLRTGLGSNDIGLDRGQLGGGEVVKFIKSGQKLLLVQPNLRYRANTSNALEKKSIEEAFARSVLYGFPIKETESNSYLVDITSFLMEDTHGVTQTLKQQKLGAYKVDASRSTLWMERTKAFPKNVEFEALLTLKGEPKGWNLRSVAPNANSVSVIQHHSFVALPDSNYTPRVFDPRSGSFAISYMDYATPVDEPITKRYITRHRLEKKNPNAPISEAKEPIIYYLDPGTPEPIRSALLEGASWWNQAFESIGYKDAFQVKMLPEDADPLDVRYNVIQWVHRSTRGWSYGASITDPRTGEIIKGHVSLGSLRIRQDFMIAQALLNRPFASDDAHNDAMLAMALARIRQLSAHEVGHTLGFAHNFAASTQHNASVMDYPHPQLMLKDGVIDVRNAYAIGIGAWDKVTVAYSYGNASNNEESKYLKSVLEDAYSKGLQFISDSDARARSGAHAKAHLWDNGKDATAELERILKIRKLAIDNFSEDNIPSGTTYSTLEDVFVPLYFLHRYQTEATVKLIGGMEYDYLVKDYAGVSPKYLPKKDQKDALQMVLQTLDANALAIPKEKLSLFPPRAMDYGRNRESFKSTMGVAFDALGAAATSSDFTLGLLLDAQRANRLVQQQALNSKSLGFNDVLDQLTQTVFGFTSKDSYKAEVNRMVQFQVLQHLMALVANDRTLPQVKGQVRQWLQKKEKTWEASDDSFEAEMAYTIGQFNEDPSKFEKESPSSIPDGSPIGSFQCYGTH